MLKDRDIVSKTIFQIILYLIEVVGVSLGITFFTSYLESIDTYMNFIERMLLSYSVYQILVVVILTNLNDIKKDSYLAWLRVLKLCLIYIEYKDKEIKKHIVQQIDYQLDSGTFNDIQMRKCYENLKMNLDFLNKMQIETEIVTAEHCYEMVTLNWRFSFVLRMFK